MNILHGIKDAHVRRTRKRVARILWRIRHEDNAGLLRRSMEELPGVRVWRITKGFYDFCNIFMSDGYEIMTSGVYEKDAIMKAILRVVERLKETGDL